jgi:hypothetical protein
VAFQFTCPQGHLLEGDESQAGQQCHCPQCGMLFVIPQPVAAEAEEQEEQGYGGGFGGMGGDTYEMPQEERLLHIPCPSGHVLETPADMLGQDVLCPHCGAQFTLRETNSLEYKKQKKMADDIREQVAAKNWFNWAVVLGVLVVGALIGLIVYVAS